MDLTPPSLTTSPYSPQRSPLHPAYCVTSSYVTGSIIPPPYGSMIQVDPQLEQTMSAWSAASPATSTTSSMPSLMASDYEQYSGYDSSCLAAPYVGAPYGRPACNSPTFLRTPPPGLGDVSGRDHSGYVSRGGYVISSQEHKPKTPDSMSYNAVPGYSRSLPTRSHFTANPQYLSDEYHPQPPQKQPPHQHSSLMPSTPLPEADATWSRLKRKRRPLRKHTTKEDANFQCQIKGCGKFFSRSYNFKSHMETHDEKREYPFPCELDGCSKRFVRKTDLQRHHASVHTKERNFKCDYCGRLFARKDTLRR